MARTSICLLLLTLFLSGCATDVANRYYAAEKYPPRNPDDVEILRAAPQKPHDVIADFQSRRESALDLRKKAAMIGADAVIVVQLGGVRATSDEWAGQDSQSKIYSRIVGTAIKYK